MPQQSTNTRNEALEFARRSRRNLEFIEDAREHGADVHVITQLTISLLGLVVFPKEKLLLDKAKTKTLADMHAEGWPAGRSHSMIRPSPQRPSRVFPSA